MLRTSSPDAAGTSETASGTRLMPDDFDRALRRMKAELAVTELRRRLLDPDLGARAVLELSDRIAALQTER
jgi:hypothetical protein